MQIKILVVDDSLPDRLLIKNMLSEHCVLTAGDDVEAIRILEEQTRIDLLILNLNMHNMNGFKVLRLIKKDERFQKLRIILLGNCDEFDNEIISLQLGIVDFVCKPIRRNLLKTKIDVHVALLRAEHALEQQLDDQKHTFNLIFEQSPVGIAISYGCDPECTDDEFVLINSMYEKITGRTKKELISLGWAKITHPDQL